MKNITKAITDIGQLIRGWGSSIDHRTYRNICDDLAKLVESADGDISDKKYEYWHNANISHYEEEW